MKLTKVAQKDHGPCDLCFQEIEKGSSYYTSVRQASSAEKADPSIKKWTFAGSRNVQIKMHKTCVDGERLRRKHERWFRAFLLTMLPPKVRT